MLHNQLLIKKEIVKIESAKKEYQQQLTHQLLTVRFTKIYLNKLPVALENGKWIKMSTLVKYPFPKTLIAFLKEEGYLKD